METFDDSWGDNLEDIIRKVRAGKIDFQEIFERWIEKGMVMSADYVLEALGSGYPYYWDNRGTIDFKKLEA